MDSPEKLRAICLRRFSSLLKSDQYRWKKQIEEQMERFYHEQHPRSPEDQPRRRHHRTESSEEDFANQSIDHHGYFIEYFLHGHCPLNSLLTEHLANYLITQDQMNDFTFSLFSSSVTCLKRFIINVKYLTRLQLHLLNEHSNLIELELLFKDSNPHRSPESFYQHLCPSINSSFEDIYSIYASVIFHQKYSRKKSTTTENIFEHLPNSSDEFSHHRLLNGILNNLHPVTVDRLKSLSLSHYKFFIASQTSAARKYSLADMVPTAISSNGPSSMTTPVNLIPTNLRLLLQFRNLTTLNLSGTDMKNPCLDIIIDSLENLDTLDLSLCRSIKLFNSLLKLSSKLKWLNLYNCSFHMQQNPTIYHIFYQLKHLEYLDISLDHGLNDHHPLLIDTQSDMNKFLRQSDCLPRLKHLDISGLKIISSISLYHFLLNHPGLQFLGLFLTNEKYSSCLFDSNDVCYSKYRRYTYDLQHIPSGDLTEQDSIIYEPFLFEALTRYRDRTGFVQKILYYIFFLTRVYQPKQQNLLIELILHVMSVHGGTQAIQMASSACIYNLTRSANTEQIHVRYLAQIVQAIMNVMATFPDHQQLHKNCLLTLCSDRILHEPRFNFYRLAKLVMKDMHKYIDLAIIQPGVAILSLLTTRLSIHECALIGSIGNLKRLFQLIEQQIDRLQTIQIIQNDQSQQSVNHLDLMLNHPQQLRSDDTLRFCLSLLWNLTDENPIVCENFIQSMGLDLFQRLLHLFPGDNIVQTKIVGLLSNIAEVSPLKNYLYSIDIIPLMQKYMTEAIPDVAFSATGILAHLLYEQNEDEIDEDLCRRMRDAINTWKNPETNMVNYRSLKQFIPLLYCTRIPVVQVWAVWAIHHVCSTDHARYGRLIREEKIFDLIEELHHTQISSSHPDNNLLQLLQSLVHLLKPDRPLTRQNSSAVAS